MDVEIVEFASDDSQASAAKKLKHNEDAVANDFEKSTIVVGLTSESLNSDNLNGSHSDMSYHDDNDADEAVDDGDDVSDYDDNDDFMFDNDDDDDNDDDYLSMQAQFDNVDLPPGVEASVSWLRDPSPSANAPASNNATGPSGAVGQPAGARMSSLKIYDPAANSKIEAAATSSSTVLAQSSSSGKEKEEKEDVVLSKLQLFKRFDTVDDFSDHHFNGVAFSGQQPPSWAKRIQEEWKILEKDLPDTIYVRVYETRIDLLRAIIVGPAGTPYHDGLFVFDVLFPTTYPDVPPHFEDLVAGHFRLQAHDILSACKAYMEGAEVGSVVRGVVEDTNNKAEKNQPGEFKEAIARMMNSLVTNFNKNGSKDCEQFRRPV
ncbi:hypothetical protein TEA_009268 [Camellia sinensis var. sinensis]|uniref:UBC core domain-containing protein n=1 Tax=Camellia sinensis var. sinensis TaxID=542762 RepID=A0A4S4DY61_CAMSN|nr:hypothetical protein TEA_009268 [Camellia sinensis var. sinensis]